jgi:YVTN family beta-propeller protein
MMNKVLYALLVFSMLITACKKESETPQPPDSLNEGVFVVNQGNFTVGNASLSYLEPGRQINGLFYQVNEAPLGDVAQSMTFGENTAYIVVNNSRLVYGIDRKTAVVQGKISDLVSPRHMLIVDDQKAYVSDLFDFNIAIVNPSTYQVTGSVPVGRTTEEMALINNEVFAANWSGYNQPLKNNKVLVIDPATDKMIDSIQVGVEPHSMVVDKNNNLWVLCTGGFDPRTKEKATLWKLDAGNRQAVDTLTFEDIAMFPTNLEISGGGDTLFYLNNGVFSMSIGNTSLPEEAFIKEENNRNFEFLGVDPENGDIYASNPLDYTSTGIVYQYNYEGSYRSQYETGIVPGAFGFNYGIQ